MTQLNLGVQPAGVQPALVAGTVLQNRYRILRLLGQGGFARTYLAEDQGRFDEYCVLKEFIPSQGSSFLLEKAREMFRREATILYQIQHDQIPRFRATFEFLSPAGARLFLVQDYVAGRTYRQWLAARQEQNQTFSEAEIRQMFQQLLPVLAYLHAGGIIHRDISPENIILRQADQCPVLIDFGVVKEIASRLHEPQPGTPGTAVGKLGYAPIEQLQTGRSYPSSDLYSLAVTALVLLTGQEPRALFEDQSLTWRWQSFVDVLPDFANVLNRMLSHRPGDRFQSANEILQALADLPPPIATLPAFGPQPLPTSDAMTMMFASSPTKAADLSTPRVDRPNVTQQQRPHLFYLGGLGLVTAVLGGLTLLLIQRQSFSPAPVASPIPMPLPSVITPIVIPSPTTPVTYDRPLALVSGNPTVVTGTLQRNETLNYQIAAQAGQQLQVQLQENVGVVVRLFDPNRISFPQFEPQQPWNATLRRGGLYLLQIQALPSQKQNRYQLTVSLVDPPISLPTNPTSSNSPGTVSSPNSRPSPAVPLNQISFAPGQRFRELKGKSLMGKPQRFLIAVKPGQRLSAVVVNGFVTLNLRAPNGRYLAFNVLDWQGRVRAGGTYQVEVVPQSNTAYELKLGLR